MTNLFCLCYLHHFLKKYKKGGGGGGINLYKQVDQLFRSQVGELWFWSLPSICFENLFAMSVTVFKAYTSV